jgi:putative FmdB family regulatory protein
LIRPDAVPIYAYRCENCGFAKDVLQKLSDEPLTDCPSCATPNFKKQLSAPGFQLKGSGWYVTDFRDGGGKKEPAKDASKDTTAAPAADTGAASGTPAASDAKPAAAPVSTPAPTPAAGKAE